MKNKGHYFLALLPLLVLTLLLSGCKIMMPSDYKKAKEVLTEECHKVGLKGEIHITKVKWTALEIPTYHVSYTYSEKTYDGQRLTLEDKTFFHYTLSNASSDNLPEYKEAYLEQKSLQKKEKEIEKQLKKQSLGLPISSLSFLANLQSDEKEQILDTLAAQNLKDGKRDFAGYYHIPFQTLINQELIQVTIYIDEDASVTEQDMKKAAEKLNASRLPDGDYDFFYYHYNISNDSEDETISYPFKVEGGRVIFDEEE